MFTWQERSRCRWNWSLFSGRHVQRSKEMIYSDLRGAFLLSQDQRPEEHAHYAALCGDRTPFGISVAAPDTVFCFAFMVQSPQLFRPGVSLWLFPFVQGAFLRKSSLVWP
jgi:hypothetical protein